MTKAKATKPGKPGRPSKRTPAIVAHIIAELSAGTPLTVICKADDMPGVSTVYDWMDRDAAFTGDIARAREIGHDAIAAEGLEIVDNVTEDPASRRVRADYRLKLLAKWDKRYADRQQLDHTSSDGSMSPPKTLADFYGERPDGAAEP